MIKTTVPHVTPDTGEASLNEDNLTAEADYDKADNGKNDKAYTVRKAGAESLKANFPVFMKLIVALLVFNFLPFLINSMIISWNYNHSFERTIEQVPIAPQEREMLLDNFHATEHDLRIKTGALLIMFSIFMVAGVIIASKILVHPLVKFLDSMQRLSRGHFETRIDRQTNDEFAIFAYYFNQMSEQLERSHKRDKWVSLMKTQLLALAAHQLRTPLTAIHWILNMLKEQEYGKLTARQRKAIEKGLASTKRMTHLISSLLNVTAIEEGRFGYNFGVVDINTLIQQTLKHLQTIAESKKISISTNIPQDLPQIYADADKMQLALENILSNAIHYTPPRGKVSISIQTDRDKQKKEKMTISVRDSGIGIDKKDLQKLFSRFFRTQKAVAMHTEGAGLGLFITRNIIRRHGGDIHVISAPNKGSEVTITIPVNKEQIPQKEVPSEHFLLG
jgi:signal transduction histidine kinase